MDKCYLCSSSKKDDNNYGEFLSKRNISVHTYCLYLTSNLCQNGSENNGLCGFKPSDIIAERRRTRRLYCCYCRQPYANIGCCVTKCRLSFHLICGLEHGAENQFIGTYESFCHQHARKSTTKPKNTSEQCCICYDNLIGAGEEFNVLHHLQAPCCQNGWFHKECLQRFAKTSGYFFKCPLCNDKETFWAKLPKLGIFIPQRDADWELEPNAFAELYERPSICSAIECINKTGRDKNTPNFGNDSSFQWCNTCGAVAVHSICLPRKTYTFNCNDCISFLQGSNECKNQNLIKIQGLPMQEDEYIDVENNSNSNDGNDTVDENLVKEDTDVVLESNRTDESEDESYKIKNKIKSTKRNKRFIISDDENILNAYGPKNSKLCTDENRNNISLDIIETECSSSSKNVEGNSDDDSESDDPLENILFSKSYISISSNDSNDLGVDSNAYDTSCIANRTRRRSTIANKSPSNDKDTITIKKSLAQLRSTRSGDKSNINSRIGREVATPADIKLGNDNECHKHTKFLKEVRCSRISLSGDGNCFIDKKNSKDMLSTGATKNATKRKTLRKSIKEENVVPTSCLKETTRNADVADNESDEGIIAFPKKIKRIILDSSDDETSGYVSLSCTGVYSNNIKSEHNYTKQEILENSDSIKEYSVLYDISSNSDSDDPLETMSYRSQILPDCLVDCRESNKQDYDRSLVEQKKRLKHCTKFEEDFQCNKLYSSASTAYSNMPQDCIFNTKLTKIPENCDNLKNTCPISYETSGIITNDTLKAHDISCIANRTRRRSAHGKSNVIHSPSKAYADNNSENSGNITSNVNTINDSGNSALRSVYAINNGKKYFRTDIDSTLKKTSYTRGVLTTHSDISNCSINRTRKSVYIDKNGKKSLSVNTDHIAEKESPADSALPVHINTLDSSGTCIRNLMYEKQNNLKSLPINTHDLDAASNVFDKTSIDKETGKRRQYFYVHKNSKKSISNDSEFAEHKDITEKDTSIFHMNAVPRSEIRKTTNNKIRNFCSTLSKGTALTNVLKQQPLNAVVKKKSILNDAVGTIDKVVQEESRNSARLVRCDIDSYSLSEDYSSKFNHNSIAMTVPTTTNSDTESVSDSSEYNVHDISCIANHTRRKSINTNRNRITDICSAYAKDTARYKSSPSTLFQSTDKLRKTIHQSSLTMVDFATKNNTGMNKEKGYAYAERDASRISNNKKQKTFCRQDDIYKDNSQKTVEAAKNDKMVVEKNIQHLHDVSCIANHTRRKSYHTAGNRAEADADNLLEVRSNSQSKILDISCVGNRTRNRKSLKMLTDKAYDIEDREESLENDTQYSGSTFKKPIMIHQASNANSHMLTHLENNYVRSSDKTFFPNASKYSTHSKENSNKNVKSGNQRNMNATNISIISQDKPKCSYIR